jgi:hypothetical protein
LIAGEAIARYQQEKRGVTIIGEKLFSLLILASGEFHDNSTM